MDPFEEWFVHNWPAMVRFAQSRTRQHIDAEDVVSHTVMRVYPKYVAGEYPLEKMNAIVSTAICHYLVDETRKSKHRSISHSQWDLERYREALHHSEEEEVENKLAVNEARDRFNAAARSLLRKADRGEIGYDRKWIIRALEMMASSTYTVGEGLQLLADEFGISFSAAKSRMWRVRTAVLEEMQRTSWRAI